MTLRWLRLWAVALVVGVSSQHPGPPPAASACTAEVADVVRSAAGSRTSVLTCLRAVDDDRVFVSVRDGNPHLGEPCDDVQLDRVRFVVSEGTVKGTFDLFGGLSQGTLRLSAAEADMIGSHVAYVAEVQLGSYEPRVGSGWNGLSCSLNPTYHFDCPMTRQVDRLCLIWLPRTPNSDDG